MTRRFPKKSFVALGALPVERLGLSAGRAETLRLQQAWARAAGLRLSAKASPERIRRGVLELTMQVDDEVWCRTIYEVMPSLAAAIAAAHPDLGITAVGLTAAGGRGVGEVLPVYSEKSSSPG